MTHLLTHLQDSVQWITFNRIDKHNAFDNVLLEDLCQNIQQAEANPQVRVIIINANGKHFSAGADLQWMQRMIHYTEAENKADADVLARTLYTLYHCHKPTIAMVQGAAFGGGAGLVAACDIAVAAHQAQFCFSEVKLGLIPAVISPYVIRALGERAATWLFMSAQIIDAAKAVELNLVQYCVPNDTLQTVTTELAHQVAKWPAQAVIDAKSLVRQVAGQPINAHIKDLTATLIAKKRVSPEAQQALQAFLNKK